MIKQKRSCCTGSDLKTSRYLRGGNAVSSKTTAVWFPQVLARNANHREDHEHFEPSPERAQDGGQLQAALSEVLRRTGAATRSTQGRTARGSCCSLHRRRHSTDGVVGGSRDTERRFPFSCLPCSSRSSCTLGGRSREVAAPSRALSSHTPGTWWWCGAEAVECLYYSKAAGDASESQCSVYGLEIHGWWWRSRFGAATASEGWRGISNVGVRKV